MSDQEMTFVDGLVIRPPHEKAPEFVKAQISMKREELIAWLTGRTEEWINVDVLVSKSTGKWYGKLNDYKPKQDGGSQDRAAVNAAADNSPEIRDEDIPF